MKECTRCKETKPLEDFNRKAERKDGRRSRCRDCEKELDALRRATPEHKAALRRYWDTDEYKALRAAEYQRNREKIRASQKEYRKKYRKRPEVVESRRIENHNRRNSLTGTLPADCMEQLIAKYGDKCMNPECKTPESKLTIDHVKPVSKGGTNTMDNVQILCARCNEAKGNRNSNDYRPRD